MSPLRVMAPARANVRIGPPESFRYDQVTLR